MLLPHFGNTKKNMKVRSHNLFNTAIKHRGFAALCAVELFVIVILGMMLFGYVFSSPSNGMIHAKALDGTWDVASDIVGKTRQQQIDAEIQWLDDTYAEHKNGFIITETLPKSEMNDVSRIRYLYDNSEVFRKMSQMNGKIFRMENGQSLTQFGSAHNSDMMQRTAIMVDSEDDLSLDINYSLTQGKLAIQLLDPSGKAVYTSDFAQSDKKTVTVMGAKGLWSLISINDGLENNGYMQGTISIVLRQPDYLQSTDFPNVDNEQNTIPSERNPFFQVISKNGKSVNHSGSFKAKAGQVLIITATSSIKGGTVDLFLFSPSYQEERITFGDENETRTIALMEGEWGYTCTGFFESGSILINGTIQNSDTPFTISLPEDKLDTDSYDQECIGIMDSSGTWGDSINALLPYMSHTAVEKVVNIYLDRHLFPNITTSQGAMQVADTIEQALKYMTEEAQELALGRIADYY